MKRKAIISWNKDKLKTIKKDLLFFDTLTYAGDRLGLQLLMSEFKETTQGISDEIYRNELNSTISYLKEKKILTEFSADGLITTFQESINNYNKKELDEILLAAKKYSKNAVGLLDIPNLLMKYLFAKKSYKGSKLNEQIKFLSTHLDHTSRFASYLLNQTENNEFFVPIIDTLTPMYETKESEVIRLVISNVPTPNEQFSFDEILDFRSDKSNSLRYKGLLRWIRNIAKSDLTVNEIEEEIEFLTLEFENRMKLEKTEYNLSKIEVILTLPFEIAEKLVKLQWSKIPESIFKLKRIKTKLLIGETKAPGREMAYIISTKNKFDSDKN